MSKEAALRAMREARYNARSGGAGATTSRPRAPIAPPATTPAPAAGGASVAGLCGHKSMNGRTCTREHGHAAKSHRYS